MATELGKLVYTLELNDSGFVGQLEKDTTAVKESGSAVSGSMKETEESAGGLKGAFSSMAGQFIVGQAIFTLGQKVLDTVNSTIRDGIKAAQEWQTAQAGLNAELRSTHDASGMTAEEVMKLADQTEQKTAIEKSAVLTGQDMLLTFTKIGKDIFPQATQSMVDMATRMNGGVIPNAEKLNLTAIQLGKALNDPTQGMMALRRVGVEFDAQTKEQIKTLQKNGDLMGAQKLILSELGKEFGGSAAANVNTFQGQVAMLKDKFNDLIQAFIEHVLPALERFGTFLLQHQDLLMAVAGAVAGLAVVIGIALVTALWAAIGTAGIAEAVMWLIIAIGAAIGLVAYEIITHWSTLKAWFLEAVSDIKQWFHDVTSFITDAWSDTAKFVIHAWDDVVQWFKDTMHVIELGILGIAAIIFWPVTVGLVMWHFFHKQIMEIFETLVSWLKNIMTVVLAILLLPLLPAALLWRRFHQDIIEGFQMVIHAIEAMWNLEVKYFEMIVNAIKSVFNGIKNFIIGIFLWEWNGVVKIWDFLEPYFKALIDGAIAVFNKIKGVIIGIFLWEWNGVVKIWDAVTGFFKHLMDSIINAVKAPLSSFGTMLYDAGKSLVMGLVKGIVDYNVHAVNAIKDLGKGILQGAKDVLKVFSPSKEFADIGMNVSLGMAQGIQDSSQIAVRASNGLAQGVLNGGNASPVNNNNTSNNQSVVYQFGPGSVTLQSREAVDEFFSIGNRNVQLEGLGISPLAGTTSV